MKKTARFDVSKKLKMRRKKIDEIDQKLLSLINHRLHIVSEIGKLKKGMGKKIYDPSREKEILKNLNLNNEGPLKERDLKKIFTTIIEVCRRSQYPD